MNFWKRLRWIASIALAVIVLIAFALALVHHLSGEEIDADESESELRAIPSVALPVKGQSTRNNTGL